MWYSITTSVKLEKNISEHSGMAKPDPGSKREVYLLLMQLVKLAMVSFKIMGRVRRNGQD